MEYNDMFPVTDSIIGNKISYMPVSNMGLKRFIFLENSRIDTRANIIDKKFEYNSYTYICRGGEVYYLHLLHTLNANSDKKEIIEKKLNKIVNSMPEISSISKFIQKI